ncbi:MAG TPA: ion channel [Solirubrobacteraceae bacterium]
MAEGLSATEVGKEIGEPVTDPSSTLATRRQRYGLLLGAIILAFAIQGIAEPGKAEQIIIAVLLGVTLLLALWAAETKPRVMRPAALLVAVVIIASIVETANGGIGGGATRIANALLVGLAPPAIIIGVIRSLRARGAVTLEAVFGVLCVYILLGMFFAFIYGTIDRFGGDPFFAGGQSATVANCLYFSFSSLTTAGYGDFTARTNLGHTLSVSEALLGQIYLVTIVSLIVANLGRSRPASKAQ